jgi:hypothetical protein
MQTTENLKYRKWRYFKMQYFEKVINILIELKNLDIDISPYLNEILNKLKQLQEIK